MDGDRGYSQVVQPEQWLRCQFDNTVLVPNEGVTLQWTDDTPKPTGPRGHTPAGLTFDRWCRAYRSRRVHQQGSPDKSDGSGPLYRSQTRYLRTQKHRYHSGQQSNPCRRLPTKDRN